MNRPVIWHNPRCSKSRAGLALLQDLGQTPEVRLYLTDPPSLEELQMARSALAIPAFAMLRKRDAAMKAEGITSKSSEEDLLAFMAAHPSAIERPIVFSQGRAVIGRPTEAIAALFDAP